jgi:hypothetical protein
MAQDQRSLTFLSTTIHLVDAEELSADFILCFLRHHFIKNESYIEIKGRHLKNSRTDVQNLEETTYTSIGKPGVELHRDGLFDHIPEGVFHQLSRLKKQNDVSEYIKRNRKVESYCRRIFQPVEFEIIKNWNIAYTGMYYLNLAEDKFELISKRRILSKLFGIPSWIPEKLLFDSVHLLVNRQELCGDIEEISWVLGKILRNKCTHKVEQGLYYDPNIDPQSQYIMGVNTILAGKTFYPDIIKINLIFSLQSFKDLKTFRQDYHKFINWVIEILFPVETVVNVEYELSEAQVFELNGKLEMGQNICL